MSEQTCDPRALAIARSVHQAEQPELTILFGSRARGDWREHRSDIDIMLIADPPRSREEKSRIAERAETQAAVLYQQDIPVQVVGYSPAEFRAMRRTANHVIGRAVREGVVMPRHPESYESDYQDDDLDYAYEWTVTAERVRHAERHIVGFTLLSDHTDNDDLIGQQAQGIMEHALKALISACGESYPTIHRINQLTERARRADPEFEFAPGIPGNIYNQYAGRYEYEPTATPITQIPGYREIVLRDAALILARVQQVRETHRPPETGTD